MAQLEMTFESRAPIEDRPRLSKQCRQIVDLLRQRPATNVELAALALKYTSRLDDIRKAGFNVVAERVSGGLWRYELIESENSVHEQSDCT